MSKCWKTLVAAVVMAGGVSSIAIADEYVYEPVGKGFAPPPVFAWTGWYAGFHAGWIRSESEATLTSLSGEEFELFSEYIPRKLSHDSDGFLAGLTLGYNQKMGASFVAGIESDIAYTDVGGSQTRTLTGNGNNNESIVTGSASVSTDMKWFGTVRARAGWLVSQQTLLYATGGLAYANFDHSASVSLDVVCSTVTLNECYGFNETGSRSRTSWKAGWTAGGGIEWLLGNKTTFKLEGLYYDLEDSSITVVLPDPNTARYKIDNTGYLARMGLNVALY